MGYIRHDAIIVTSFNEEGLTQARGVAIKEGLKVTDITEGNINGYVSFLIVPDGSKEGWEESDRCDDARASWKAWARQNTPNDVLFDWVHVSYAGDLAEDTKVVDHTWKGLENEND